MKLDEYLTDKESASVRVGASQSAEQVRNGGSGTLACTPYRLVYVDGNNVTDISLKGVNSIQYREMEYPSNYLASGGILTALGVVLAAVAMLIPDIGPIPTVIWMLLGTPLVIGIATLIWGLFVKRSSLIVHTPNKTYKFFSTDSSLKEIGHTVRGHEMKS